MSDNKAMQKNAQSEKYQSALTFGEVNEYLKEKILNDKCPCCESSDWGVDLVENDRVVEPGLVSFTWDGLPMNPKHIELVSTVCVSCGYVRLFSGHYIRSWREARIPPEKK